MMRKLIHETALTRTAVNGSTKTPAEMLIEGIPETGGDGTQLTGELPVGPISRMPLLEVVVYFVNSLKMKSDVDRSADKRLAKTATRFLAVPPAFAANTDNAAPAMGTIQIRLGMRLTQSNELKSPCCHLRGNGRCEIVLNNGLSTRFGATPNKMVRKARKIIGASM